MIVTKRFELSAAHQVPDSRHERERRLHGHNYVMHIGIGGEPDPVTGLVINLATLESHIANFLDGYDHRYLNDLPGLARRAGPMVENVAEVIWTALTPRYPDPPLARVTLSEDYGNAAIVTGAGTWAVARGEFAAAHRTHIPTYSDESNRALFGICNNPAGHGHNYRLIVHAQTASETLAEHLSQALREFDHRNLSFDIPDLAGRNVTTEVIARLLWDRLQSMRGRQETIHDTVALRRIRLYELSDFFAEYAGKEDAACLGRRFTFCATHRMVSPRLSAAENETLYGKCSRPEPHGHSYRVEVTVAGRIDNDTGLAMNLADLDGPAGAVIGALDGRQLDADVAWLRDRPVTGENITAYLWRELEARFGEALTSVRLWMTRTNSFEIDR